MNDFYFDKPDALDLGGPVEKQRVNTAAIRILKQCQAENRPATVEEQQSLARYVGWGDAKVLVALHDSEELRAMLTEEEIRAARGSSLNAHYTALPVIGAIWESLLHMGLGSLRRIRALDPSAGIGHFKSLTPGALRTRTEWIEIELDKLTAGILSLLHPGSKLYAGQGFEQVNLPPGWFDLAISNVPFGNYGVVSKNVLGFSTKSIHDFFFANSVALLRLGGVMAYITSRYTLDKQDSQTRTWLARQMDLLAAVRLPNTAFKANAGTEVVSDILILQKREREQVEMPRWAGLKTEYRQVGSYHREPVYFSQYYGDHPEMILGKVTFNGTMYRSDGYNVESDGRDLAEAIRSALISALPANCLAPVDEPQAEETAPPVIITTAAKGRSTDAEKRIQAMQEIYRLAKLVLALEISGTSLFETSEVRFLLNQAYDFFVSVYGAINKPVNAKLLISIFLKMPSQVAIAGSIFCVLVALPSAALQKSIQIQVDRALYGGYYDYKTVTSDFSNRLAQTMDRSTFINLLTHDLPEKMKIKESAVLLLAENSLEMQGDDDQAFSIPLGDEICEILSTARGPVRALNLWSLASSDTVEHWRQFSWAQLFVPIVHRDTLYGVLIVGDRTTGNIYSNQDLQIVGTVGQQAALSIANIILVEALRGLTQRMVRSDEEQRKKVARDLHDSVLQGLFFIKQRLDRSDPEAAAFVEHTITSLRNTIKAQRPSLLDRGLSLALQDLIGDVEKLTDDDIVILWHDCLEEEIRLSDEKTTSIYRIVQESLSNVLKHAKADRAIVTAKKDNGFLEIQIEDDGIGISSKSQAQIGHHYGLLGMKERATMIGADLTINSEPGKGTNVRVRMNIQDTQHASQPC